MKLVVFLIALIPFISVNGQKSLPGGVQGACIWEITEINNTGQAKWISKLKGPADTGLLIKGKNKTINNNPALFFSEGNNTINSTLNLGELASFSLFTVCQENDTLSERVIISLENDTAAEMVLTNRRMAALDVYRYANYNLSKKLTPKLYSYSQNKTNDNETVSRRLHFGRPPHNQYLPVSVYNGIVPEVILFPRFISPAERQKVESYLALKYGISLNQEFPVSYLNSNGEVIWDAEMNERYNKNIAGIGRDDLSGLNQRISESTQTPGELKIGVIAELRNNSFLIWGDNGKPLRLINESGVLRLQRDWKISAFNFDNKSISIETDQASIHEINPLRNGERYWLMTDESGTGKYPFGQTKYLQCLPSSLASGFVKFDSVIADADHSGSDVFTLIAAPSFFARCTVLAPTCSSVHSGAIQVEIAGGSPPFEIVLRGIPNTMLLLSSGVHARDQIFEGISQGSYVIQVTDADKKIYTEKIRVSNTHLWETKINQNYKLAEGESLVLNASEGMPAVDYVYSWTEPNGNHVNNEEIRISQCGTYFLSVTDDNNCNSTLEINVIQSGRSNFKDFEIYPNPVRGWFTLRLSLERTADVNVVISDMTGKKIKQTRLSNDQFYVYTDVIRQPGIYNISLISENDKETLKLIVQ
jgi:hypothetical protein